MLKKIASEVEWIETLLDVYLMIFGAMAAKSEVQRPKPQAIQPTFDFSTWLHQY